MNVDARLKPILCADPGAQTVALRAEIDDAIARVLDSGWFILGKEVSHFESEFAAYCGVEHAIGVGNGTDAIELALRASGIGSGDEVITVSHTAVATVCAILRAGAIPHLVDVRFDDGLMNLDAIESAITPRTRAVVGVHLYGQTLDAAKLRGICDQHGLVLIEDCAQAHGARINGHSVGTFGDLAAFSFYPTKNLGALGDGGAVVTRNSLLATRVRELREYGWRDRYVSAIEGMNSRLDEMQAAILRTKLKHLDAGNDARRAIAERYIRALNKFMIILPSHLDGSDQVFHLFVIRHPNRNALQQHLKNNFVYAGIHYPVPIHLQPGYANLVKHDGLPVTEQLAQEILSLPMYPELTAEDQGRVIRAVCEFFEGNQ